MAKGSIDQTMMRLLRSRFGQPMIWFRGKLLAFLAQPALRHVAFKCLSQNWVPNKLNSLTLRAIRSHLATKAELDEFHVTMSRLLDENPKKIAAMASAMYDFRYYTCALKLASRAEAPVEILSVQIRALLQSARREDAENLLALKGEHLSSGESEEIAELVSILDADHLGIIARLMNNEDISGFVARADEQDIEQAYLSLKAIGEYRRATTMLTLACQRNQTVRFSLLLAQEAYNKFDVTACREILNSVERRGSRNGLYWELLGDIASFEQRYEAANEAYLKSLKYELPVSFSPSVFRKMQTVDLHCQNSKKDAFFHFVSKLRPKTARTLIILARVHLESGSLDEHLKYSNEARQLEPKSAIALHWYGHGLAWMTSIDDLEKQTIVIDLYEQAMSIAGSHPWWILSDFLRVLAHFGQTEKRRKVVERYKNLIELPDIAPKMASSMALYYADEGNLTESLAQSRWSDQHTLLNHEANGFTVHAGFDTLDANEPCLFLSEGGVGDEIRFSSFYSKLLKRFPNAKFTCDQRLQSALEQVVGKDRLVPTQRLFNTPVDNSLDCCFDKLPHRGLVHYFDNSSIVAAQQAGQVMTVKNAIAELLRTQVQTSQRAHFTIGALAHSKAVAILPKDLPRPWVGISWTSRTEQYRRAPHYFTTSELTDVVGAFAGTFFNMNYFNNYEQIESIEQKTGKRIYAIDGIDMLNDFVGQFAVLDAMDLVVSVNNAVIESAGAIGKRALFCAFGAENHWRKGTNGRDRYFDSVEVIVPSESFDDNAEATGKRQSVINQLNDRLAELF